METNVWSPEGRIRRSTYFERMLIVLVLLEISSMVPEDFLETLSGILIYAVINLTLCGFLIIQGSKRMHDINVSGWYQLIPIYGLILAFTDGTPGDNKYGKNPKEVGTKTEPDIVVMTLLICAFVCCGIYALFAIF